MGLIFTLHLHKRTADLHIYSHRGLDEIITTQLKYSQSAPSYKLIFHRLEKDEQKIIYEDEAVTVETIPLKHKLHCSGFLFREKPKPRRIDKEKLPPGLLIQEIVALKRGEDLVDDQGNIRHKNLDLTLSPRHARSYAYCSDTAFDLTLTKQIAGIDLLYHEATFLKDDQSKARETLHSTAEEAATIAAKAEVSKLLLGHFSARNKDLTPLLDEARAVFQNSHLALEGEEFTIDE
jgi:ribonuclease Z